jgi:hypothetical protein
MLNQRNPLNSFWTDEELVEYLNEGVRLYFAEVIMNNEGYFTAQSDLDIVTDTDTIALPTDCYQVRTVYKKVTDGYVILPYRNNMTEGYSTKGGTSGNNYLPYYYFRANNLVLRPVPNFSETSGIRLEYIQFPDTMVYGGDSLTNQVSPIFKQVIEMYAVYKAKLRESLVNGTNTYAPAEENLGVLIKQFRDSIQSRSKNPTFVIPFNPETDGM